MSKNTIIVAVDFKDDIYEICREAVHYALKLKSTITLVHALEHEVYFPYFPYDQDKIDESERIENLQNMERLETYVEEHGIKLEKSIIERGKTYEIICSTADRVKARAIVIGVGKHYLFEELIGSTTEKVARMASQKVIIINHKKHKECRNVLAAFDFSDGGIHALRSAVRCANFFKAKLCVLHVYDVIKSDEEIISCLSQICQEEINDELNLLGKKELPYDIIVRKGNTFVEILECIKNKNIQLLSIGSSGHSALTSFFLGSTVAKIIRKAPCSIVVSPKSG